MRFASQKVQSFHRGNKIYDSLELHTDFNARIDDTKTLFCDSVQCIFINNGRFDVNDLFCLLHRFALWRISHVKRHP